MKKILFTAALGFCLSISGCSYVFGPVKLAQAFTDGKTAVIDEMQKKVVSNPTAAGVADARKAFESKKADLTAKRDELKAAPRGMNVDWQTELSAMEDRQSKQLDGIGIKLSVDCKDSCSEVEAAWKSLRKDFDESVKRY